MVDFDEMDDGNLFSHLSNQIEVYSNLQSLGHKISRMVVGIFVVIITLIGIIGRVVTINTITNVRSTMSSSPSISGVDVFIGYHTWLVALGAFVFSIFLIDSFIWANRSIKVHSLQPKLGDFRKFSENPIFSEFSEGSDKSLDEYLVQNANIISKVQFRVQKSVKSLQIAGYILFIMGFIVYTWFVKTAVYLFFTDIIISIIILAFAVRWGLKVKIFYNENYDKNPEDKISYINEMLSEFLNYYRYDLPSSMVLLLLIIGLFMAFVISFFLAVTGFFIFIV